MSERNYELINWEMMDVLSDWLVNSIRYDWYIITVDEFLKYEFLMTI